MLTVNVSIIRQIVQMSKSERLLQIIQILRRHKNPVAGESMAGELKVSLRTFYRDETKATGWNNLAFPSVGMPHVLWELQGERRALFDVVSHDGQETHVFKGWEQISKGKMTEQEYDKAVGDLVNYLQWMGEPAQDKRKTLGMWVLAYLAIFIFVAWRLNAAFWKDVK